MHPTSRHQCLIYKGSPAQHLPALAALMRQKLEERHRCLYLDSPPMVAGMRSYLAAAGVDVAREVGKGSLVLSSDQGHLVDGHFDADLMLRALEVIRQSHGRFVHAQPSALAAVPGWPCGRPVEGQFALRLPGGNAACQHSRDCHAQTGRGYREHWG